jgi:hypothetical protein
MGGRGEEENAGLQRASMDSQNRSKVAIFILGLQCIWSVYGWSLLDEELLIQSIYTCGKNRPRRLLKFLKIVFGKMIKENYGWKV